MQENNNSRHTRENIQRILAELTEGNPTEGLLSAIQGWLIDSDNLEEKDEELLRVFIESLKFDPNPDTETHRMLAQLEKRLGFPAPKRARIPLYKRATFKVAAVLIPAALVVGTLFFVGKDDETDSVSQPVLMSVRSVVGDRQRIMLPDSSEVVLKGSTTISYADDFLASRNVAVEGEAFFSVRKMDGKPFTVEAQDIKVTVLGTEFNVRAHGGMAISEVTLASGKVEITGADKKVALAPMEQVRYDSRTKEFFVKQVTDAEILHITGETLSFEQTPLSEVFGQISSYYGIAIDVDSSIAADKTIRARFEECDKLDDVLYAIRRATRQAFDYEIAGDTVRITGNGR